jgi:uncharacterized membrane protein
MITFIRESLFTILRALWNEVGWVIVNLVAALVPVHFEAWLETPRSASNSINGIDVLYEWITTVFPFLLVILIVNIIWFIQVWRRNRGLARRRAFGAWVLVGCLWLVPLGLNRVAFTVLQLIIMMIDGQAWHH